MLEIQLIVFVLMSVCLHDFYDFYCSKFENQEENKSKYPQKKEK